MFSNRYESVLSQTNSLGNLLRLFNSYVAKKNATLIKDTWDKNDLLRSWYRGESVNFGTHEMPNMRTISLDKLIKQFKSALASQVSYVITAMWDGNPLLRSWYSGDPVNFGTNEVPDVRAISLDELIKNFKSVLASHSRDIIKDMWKGNPLLQDWYIGQSVNFGTNEVPDMRAISLEELIKNFKSALASQVVSYITKIIWDESLLLRLWYSGAPVNFGTNELADIRSISLDELTKNFKSALASKSQYIIKNIWDGNPSLRSWYGGLPVNFGTNEVPDIRAISLDELIKNFKSALASHSRDIIKDMWDGNPLLRSWYSGEPVNFGTNELPHIRAISLDELIKNFKPALASRISYVIKKMWFGSLLLRLWYTGHPVNFGTNEVLDIRAISLDELIEHFKSALASHSRDIIKAMWGEIPLLRSWYGGEPVNFGTNEVPDVRTISFDDLIKNFKSALASHSPDIIKDMWDGPTLLRSWYSGHPVNFGTNEVPDVCTISFDDLIKNFKSALASHSPDIIKDMWDGPTLLRSWYSGHPVNFGTNEVPDVCTISFDDLIKNFKSALASHSQDIIKDMWDKNERLHHTIHALDLNKSQALLKKVMSSSKEGKSDFISQYVNELDKAIPLNKVLEDIQKSCRKKTSAYKANQMRVLRNRLTELGMATNRPDRIAVTEKRSSDADATILDLSTSQAQSSANARKRKASSKLTQRSTKKQKIEEITQAELSDLVSKMPTELNDQNNFCVTEELGKRIQKLPQTIKDEWGIKSIRKIRRQSEYKGVAEKLKYRAFLIKHSHSLLEDSLPVALHTQQSSQSTLFGHSYKVQNPSPLPRNDQNLSLNLEIMEDRIAKIQ